MRDGQHANGWPHWASPPPKRRLGLVGHHRAPAVPLHPEAVGCAGHYDFDIDVLAAYRPTGKGRVERQVLIVRHHVLSGRAFSSIE